MREASVERATRETKIRVRVDLDGTGVCRAATGIGFLDHMLEQLARHGMIDLEVEAEGDLHVDFHHTTEDTGIEIGRAHVCTPVTNAHLVCRLLLETTNTQ